MASLCLCFTSLWQPSFFYFEIQPNLDLSFLLLPLYILSSFLYIDEFPSAYKDGRKLIQCPLHGVELSVRYTFIFFFFEESPSTLEDPLTQLAKLKGNEFTCILDRC